MSQSVRLNSALVDAAKSHGPVFHRSPPQQIEHWAAIGRVMEQALSYHALEEVVRSVGGEELDQALAEVGTAAGTAKARKIIRRTSAKPDPR